jgi:hypothetical protein
MLRRHAEIALRLPPFEREPHRREQDGERKTSSLPQPRDGDDDQRDACREDRRQPNVSERAEEAEREHGAHPAEAEQVGCHPENETRVPPHPPGLIEIGLDPYQQGNESHEIRNNQSEREVTECEQETGERGELVGMPDHLTRML